jgi:hypothetical protein
MAVNFAVLRIVKIPAAASFDGDPVRRDRDGFRPDDEEEERLAERRARAARWHGDTPMVDLSKLFDSYSRQARLFPGLLTLFPIILTAIAWFPRLVTSSWGATLVAAFLERRKPKFKGR